MDKLALWMVFCLGLLFRKPPYRFFSMNGFIIETRIRRPLLMKWFLSLVLFALGIAQASFMVPSDPVAPPNHEASSVPDSVACAAAFVAEQDAPSCSPRDMGSWDSDSFPIVLDSGTSKSTTPVYSDLINPRPFHSRLQGVGQGKIMHCWECFLQCDGRLWLNGCPSRQ